MRAQGTYVMGRAGRLLAIAAIGCASARASVAVLLEQPYGMLGHFDSGGHTAVYLDHVCAETPVKLRPCGAGELGVVISRYDGIDKKDWVAMPLMAYLYAVDSATKIPESVNKEDVAALRDAYRRKYLESLAPDRPDGKAPEGNWYELGGAAYDRAIYGFSLQSTPEQDAKLMAMLNDGANVQTYNGLLNNCADFARTTVNMYYPHAVRRNWIADGFVMTPKAVARAVSKYAKKHPEAGMQVFMIPQVAGTLPRSHPAQVITEALLKRYQVPLVVLSPEFAGMVFTAYMVHGRFDMPKDAPVMNLRVDASVMGLQKLVEKPAVVATAEGTDAAGSTSVPATLRAASMVVAASH